MRQQHSQRLPPPRSSTGRKHTCGAVQGDGGEGGRTRGRTERKEGQFQFESMEASHALVVLSRDASSESIELHEETEVRSLFWEALSRVRALT